MDEQTFKRAQRLSEEISQSEAQNVERRLRYLVRIFLIFDKNYQELKILLTATVSLENLWLHDVEKREEFKDVMWEILRLLHNFLASAFMLVDNTRALIRDFYRNHPFYQEYQSKIESIFVGNPFTSFVQDLRNCTLHYQFPGVADHFEAKVDSQTGKHDMKTSINLSKSSLMEYKEWNASAKVYLEAAPEDIPLDEVSDSYYQLVRDFRVWMQNRLIELHTDELTWLSTKRQELKQMLKGHF